MEFLVNLNKVDDVKNLCREAEKLEADVIVKNIDRTFSVDGTSLMGIFSLDLTNPVIVDVPDTIKGEVFKSKLSDILV